MSSITKNIFLSYSTYKTDYKIPIIYTLYMELPIYIIPIFPNLGDYVDTMIRFLLPLIFVYITYRELVKEKVDHLRIRNESKIRGNIRFVAFAIFVVLFISITCGWFKYYTLTIGSGSMTPNINKGDMIIVEKLSKQEIEDLKVGEILVFKYDQKTIVHRIVEINNDMFYTKGDANNKRDDYAVKSTDIIGTTKLRIRIIGYPVVWLNELVNKR